LIYFFVDNIIYNTSRNNFINQFFEVFSSRQKHTLF